MLHPPDGAGEGEILLRHLQATADRDVRRELHSALAASPAARLRVDGLRAVSTTDELGTWAWAARRWDPSSLDATARRTMVEVVARHARSPEPRRRQRAAELLGVLRTDAARAELLRLVRDDPEDRVRATAAEALGGAGRATDAEVDALLALLDASDRSWPDSSVLHALVAGGHPRALARLERGLRTPDRQAPVALALGGGGEAGADLLGRRFDELDAETDPECELRRTLLGAAAETGSASWRDRLGSLAADPPCDDDATMEALVEAWAELGMIEALESATEHPSRAVRVAAMRALREPRRP